MFGHQPVFRKKSSLFGDYSGQKAGRTGGDPNANLFLSDCSVHQRHGGSEKKQDECRKPHRSCRFHFCSLRYLPKPVTPPRGKSLSLLIGTATAIKPVFVIHCKTGTAHLSDDSEDLFYGLRLESGPRF